jgi:IstB-like ATP binding protein
VITSNRVLGDAALATAILDRLLHRSVLVEFRGKSYRLKEAASQLAKGSANESNAFVLSSSHWGNLTWPQMQEFEECRRGWVSIYSTGLTGLCFGKASLLSECV